MSQGLLEIEPPVWRIQWLSSDCWIDEQDQLVIVGIAGSPVFRFVRGDVVGERLAAATIVDAGAARVSRVLEAFGMDDATLWRARQALAEGGVEALIPRKRGPKGPRGPAAANRRRIETLGRSGLSAQAIGDRVGMPRSTVRGVLARAGIATPKRAETGSLLEAEAATAEAGLGASVPDEPERCTSEADEPLAVEVPGSAEQLDPNSDLFVESPLEANTTREPNTNAEDGDGAPADELIVKAPTNEPLLDEEAPLSQFAISPLAEVAALAGSEASITWQSRRAIPALGLLLAMPALASTGIFEASRSVYGRLRSGTYGLRAVVLLLSAMALLRRPRPEALKNIDPIALGRLLGLERAPEVKTLRRKLGEIATRRKASELMRALTQRWLADAEDILGIVYIDGHVRVYNGKHRIPKAHITQRNLSLRATTDYWANDADGQPLLIVPATANAALTQMVPQMIDEIEALAPDRRGTVVFDRGGWSPALFADLVGRGWHIITYRKGHKEPHPPESFSDHALDVDGRHVELRLSERLTTLRNGLQIREIAEEREDGGQTIVITSHMGKPAALIAYRMFQRWRQENYFRYMKENFALDALVEYGVEPSDPDRMIPNPARKAHLASIASARAEVAQLHQAYGAAMEDNAESERPTVRGFKIANSDIGQRLRAAQETLATLASASAAIPTRVRAGDVFGNDGVVELKAEKKLFSDIIRAAVYRAETTLHSLLSHHFRRNVDEGRNFLRTVFQHPGDLIVEGDVATIQLYPLSAPRFTRTLTALCEQLNSLDFAMPETPYRLRFQVQDDHSPTR